MAQWPNAILDNYIFGLFSIWATTLILGVSSTGLGQAADNTGLPRSGENVWKMKFSPGQGKVGEFCG